MHHVFRKEEDVSLILNLMGERGTIYTHSLWLGWNLCRSQAPWVMLLFVTVFSWANLLSMSSFSFRDLLGISDLFTQRSKQFVTHVFCFVLIYEMLEQKFYNLMPCVARLALYCFYEDLFSVLLCRARTSDVLHFSYSPPHKCCLGRPLIIITWEHSYLKRPTLYVAQNLAFDLSAPCLCTFSLKSEF